jgi:hypothetical protein
MLLLKKGTFTPVKTLEEAKHRVGGDTAKFLAIINEGLEAEAGRAMINDSSIPWLQEDEEGNTSVATDVKPADKKIVNGLILNLAKSVFGYLKATNKDEKRAAKEAAKNMIKSTPAMKDGLMANAAAASGETE